MVNIEVESDKLEETFITKVTIINPDPEPVPVADKYQCMFHGSGEVSYGRHYFRFPITHIGYKRLVSSFQVDYAGSLNVIFGGQCFDEI